MIGFEIIIKGQEPIRIASDSVVSILLGNGYPFGAYIHLGGSDSSYNSLTWLDGKLETGDMLTIKVIETDTASEVIRKEIKAKEWVWELYNKLEVELTEKGLL